MQPESLLFIQEPGTSLANLPRFDDGPHRVQFAHIVHAYVDHAVPFNTAVQDVTFETISQAAAQARPNVPVNCFVVTFADERHLVPQHCVAVPDLRRTVTDLANFRVPRPLPLLFDILKLGVEAADRTQLLPQGDQFIIYTNSDIHVQPYFYTAISDLIRMGYDVITINRRTIGKQSLPGLGLSLMCADGGIDHPGYDCFVFPRRLFDEFMLSNVCIGAGHVMRSLLYNMAALGRRFAVLTTAHLTFHIGDDGVWRNPQYEDYLAFNLRETRLLATRLAIERIQAVKLLEFMRRNGENRGLASAVAETAGLERVPAWRRAARRARSLLGPGRT
jgi:hypothetical protein